MRYPLPLLKMKIGPALGRLRWEDLEFKSRLGYTVRQRKEGVGEKREGQRERRKNRQQVVVWFG